MWKLKWKITIYLFTFRVIFFFVSFFTIFLFYFIVFKVWLHMKMVVSPERHSFYVFNALWGMKVSLSWKKMGVLCLNDCESIWDVFALLLNATQVKRLKKIWVRNCQEMKRNCFTIWLNCFKLPEISCNDHIDHVFAYQQHLCPF